MRAIELLAALVIPLWLASCKGSSDTGETVPRADGPGSSTVPGGAAPPPATESPAATGAAQRPPSQPAGTTTTTKPSGGTPDAGAPPDAGQPDAAASGAGSSAAKLQACADKCKGIYASCITPTFTDGGLQIKDPAACNKAMETCSSACAP